MVQRLYKIVNDEPYSKSSRKELKKFAGFQLNSDIEARKGLLTIFCIFFRCGQLTFSKAYCEVDGATRYCKSSLASPFQVAVKGSRGQSLRRKRQREKRH
ncbi:hypothetical protein TNCV_3227231 [Trichonephila clavipes]|nr:hypothetical protein TNCV_3227231 [Trichonephila clavipes]